VSGDEEDDLCIIKEADKTVKLIDVLMVLKDLGYIKGYKPIEKIKAGHSTCCCSTCGYYHDDCVCDHNDLIEKLENIEGVTDDK